MFFKKKNLEYVLSFFLSGRKCGQWVGLGCGQNHFLNQVFKSHILGNNDWIRAFFFFITRYLS
jgi:hypothetical protein